MGVRQDEFASATLGVHALRHQRLVGLSRTGCTPTKARTRQTKSRWFPTGFFHVFR